MQTVPVWCDLSSISMMLMLIVMGMSPVPLLWSRFDVHCGLRAALGN